ncbi:MAG: hypothetical protein J7L90_01295 [Dehalococcoidia bacterium]|nr:hypothetical protein [Dehalococcoidia bacterium]
MAESNHTRSMKRTRLAGRIIGIGITAFFLTFLIGETVSEIQGKSTDPLTIEGVTVGLLGTVGLAGCILCWWRERLASILLILTAVGLGIHIGICAGRNHLMAWSMLGLPYLVAGLLLLNSWQLSKKDAVTGGSHPLR